MKKLLLIMGCIMVGVHFAWAEEAMYFVSALSAPVASFNAVETKDRSLITTLPESAYVNVGSESSNSGTVTIGAGAGRIEIESLWLDDNTRLQGEDTWTKWMISDQLVVGTQGNVQLGGVLVNQLKLLNSLPGGCSSNPDSCKTDFVVTNVLKIASSLKVNAVKVVKVDGINDLSFKAGSEAGCTKSGNKYSACFAFTCTHGGSSCGSSAGNASAQTVGQQSDLGESTQVNVLGSNSTASLSNYKYIFKANN